MRAKKTLVTTVSLIASIGVAVAWGQESSSLGESGWTVTPYAWLVGISGEAGTDSDGIGGGLPPRLDITTDEELTETGFMLRLRHQWQHWDITVDSVWMRAQQDAEVLISGLLPGAVLDVEVSGNITQLTGGYKALQSDNTMLSVYGGARFYFIENTIRARGGLLVPSGTSSGDQNWIDGVVGVQWLNILGRAWRLHSAAELGFGESDSTTQVWVSLGYEFSWGTLHGGYRYLNLEYEDNNFLLDLTLEGPLIGASFRY
jgi:hypothetical protein